MNGYEYICGTAARFRKKFPNLYERKEKKPVFIDSSLLDKIEDIPDEIKAELIGKSRISRMNREDLQSIQRMKTDINIILILIVVAMTSIKMTS